MSLAMLKPKHFKHDLIELQEMETETINGRRFYATPTGEKYASMTSALKWRSEKDIKKWRKRVGEKEANRISTKASSRGTVIHDMCENYMMNNDAYLKGFTADNKAMFGKIRPTLNRIDNIKAVEAPLFSHDYCLAGRVDCIAEFDGVLSIIDFKTSLRLKKEEWVMNYFLQTTGYALMLEEMTGIKIDQIVIIIAVDDPDKQNTDAQIFVRNKQDYLEEFDMTINKFFELVEQGKA